MRCRAPRNGSPRVPTSNNPTPPGSADWQPTRAFGSREAASPPDAWQSTRAQTALATQFLKDEEEYLTGEQSDIGRQTGANERELFVSCDPAQAMQQQFEHLQPDFIAIHDIATASSRKLLLGIAAASGRAVQKLVIRRQGYGTPLATLEFVELATTDGRSLRLYTTEADADTSARHGLARTLLAFSRLGAVMVGELPGHAIAGALDRSTTTSSRARGTTVTCCCCRWHRRAPWSPMGWSWGAEPASTSARPPRWPALPMPGHSSQAAGIVCASKARAGNSRFPSWARSIPD